MRRAIIREYDKLAENLSNYVAVMNYRFMNLCVKAEPVSLLPITVMIDGESQKLEECVQLGKDGDYMFALFPKYEEDMGSIMSGVALAHPEFKQEIKQMSVTVPEENGREREQEVDYLQVTMPEVDDERYDVLKEGVKLVYDECKAQMEVANNKAKVKFTELSVIETKENLELLDNELDKLNNQWNAQRDRLRDIKLEEINSAYNKWLGAQAQKEIAMMEEEDARGTDAVNSTKMGEHE
jgi:hypothetical protein